MGPEHWRYTIGLRWPSLVQRRKADAEMDEGIRYHVERPAEELAARGMSPQQARRAMRVDPISALRHE